MSNVKILIVEDDSSYALELRMLVDELGYDVLAVVDSAEDAFEILEKQKPDLILMDIQLRGKVSGIDIAKQIEDENINIIFITNFNNQLTFDKAKTTPHFGYIVKPFNHFTLEATIEVALMNKNKGKGDDLITEWNEDLILEDFVFIKKRNRLKKVAIENIEYLEVEGNYCLIFTKNDKFILKMSLKKVRKILAEKSFLRVNKNHILNMKKISTILLSENKILMGKHSFVIGRRYKSKVISKLKLLG